MVARQHAGTINLRYLAPPAAVSVIAAGSVAGLAGWPESRPARPSGVRWLSLGLVIPVTYAAGITGVAAVLGRDVPLGVRARIPVALATMHLCWGAGFLTSSRGLLRRMARPAGN